MSRKLAKLALLTGMALVLSGFGSKADAGLFDLFRNGITALLNLPHCFINPYPIFGALENPGNFA